MKFDGKGMKKFGDYLFDLLQYKIKLNIVGCLPKYDFKIFDLYGEIHKNCIYMNIRNSLTSKIQEVGTLKEIEEQILLPSVDDFCQAIRKKETKNSDGFNTKAECLVIPLREPPDDLLKYTKYTDNMGLRIIKNYDLQTCSTVLDIDMAFIEKDVYDHLYGENKNEK